MADSLREYRQKRDFRKTAEPSGDSAPPRRPAATAISSRSTPRRGSISISASSSTACCCRWAVTRGPSLEPEGQAPRGPHRGPSARLRRLRGHHPEGRVWRRHGDALGRGHLGAGRRSRGGARQGRPQVHPPRRAAQGQVGAGPHASQRAASARSTRTGCSSRSATNTPTEETKPIIERATDQRAHRPHAWTRSPPATSNGCKSGASIKKADRQQAAGEDEG